LTGPRRARARQSPPMPQAISATGASATKRVARCAATGPLLAICSAASSNIMPSARAPNFSRAANRHAWRVTPARHSSADVSRRRRSSTCHGASDCTRSAIRSNSCRPAVLSSCRSRSTVSPLGADDVRVRGPLGTSSGCGSRSLRRRQGLRSERHPGQRSRVLAPP